jgi:DedD protein
MLNRIIGILVVLAVGVLVYPFVFNPHDRALGQATAIKAPPFPTPEIQSATIQALNKHEEPAASKLRLLKLASKQKKSTGKTLSTETKETKHAKLNLKSTAWVIQVGNYKDKVNALSVVNQLRAKGYNAFIHQASAAFGEEVQVYIGPEVKRDSATNLAIKLAKETKLSGTVKSYKLLNT